MAAIELSKNVQSTGFNETEFKAVGNPLTGALKVELSADTDVIGLVSIDQTTVGTTDSVTVKASAGIGSLTETAPATDIASSGLNGRLQRVAQHLTTQMANFGVVADAAVVDPTASASSIALLKGLLTKTLTQITNFGGVADSAVVDPASSTSSAISLLKGLLTVLTTVAGTIGAGTAAVKAFAVGGIYNSSLPTLTNGQGAALQVDASGRQIVVVDPASSTGKYFRHSAARPANDTDYAVGDVVGGVMEFTTLGLAGKMSRITGSRLEIDVTAVPTIIAGAWGFRLQLYGVTPPSALADNAVWDLPDGDRTAYLGYVDMGAPVDVGSTLYVQQTGLDVDVLFTGTSLFGYLITNAAYKPTSGAVKAATLYALGL
jgi:hypothetical protein